MNEKHHHNYNRFVCFIPYVHGVYNDSWDYIGVDGEGIYHWMGGCLVMKNQMENLKARILTTLKKARGKAVDRFKVGGWAYNYDWFNDRKTRAAIAELRAEGHPIGEISAFPGGYFYAQSKADLAPTIHRYKQRIKSCAKVLKGLEMAHSRIKRQGKLKLGRVLINGR